ncbi:sarcosine oxidase [Acuticoccus sp. M5D2P5]|uniref:sarcosine oxidase subunit gamma n=1 Tax=Acuticoccus kalidii TaxID=2910977 RepID=UPI001F29FD02|nr:sarcosine oxidase subunit gamma family protein [Acuticoccus kalidii]MCF3932338.1 sarcosine oxidase [Acuticoccus kalidii]
MTTHADGPVALSMADTGARFSLRIGVTPDDLAAAETAFGAPIFATIGARGREAGRESLCLGPDEWVLTAPEADRAPIATAFAGIGAAHPHSLVDISDREIAIDLEGEAVTALLAQGIAIDLDAFPSGHGTRTVYDGITVVLRRDAAHAFRLEAWRSFVPHVWHRLTEGNKELALGI